MADNAELGRWLRDRCERAHTPVVKAVYEGLRMRVERGDFDVPESTEQEHKDI